MSAGVAQQTKRPLALAAIVLATTLAASCGDPGGPAVPDPESRAVRIDTTACGPASRRFGSGVAVGGGLVVTVAHLIARAATVEASLAGVPSRPVDVAAVDLERDLAVLRMADDGLPGIETAIVDAGATGRIVEGAASGTVAFEVIRRVNLTIEEILGTERHARLGYELSSVTTDGDSGAGAYDDEGKLIGIVFATGEDGATTWLTATSEVEDFIASVGPTDTYELCQ